MSAITLAFEPPIRWALLLDDDHEMATAQLNSLRGEWEALLQMELVHSRAHEAAVDSMKWRHNSSLRLVGMLFDNGVEGWSLSNRPAMEWFRGLIEVMPDSKCVEDSFNT